MINKESYQNRVDKCFKILEELFSNYPSSIDEIEEDLVSALGYYRDLAKYVPPQEKVELKTFRSDVLPAKVRSPLILDLED